MFVYIHVYDVTRICVNMARSLYRSWWSLYRFSWNFYRFSWNFYRFWGIHKISWVWAPVGNTRVSI